MLRPRRPARSRHARLTVQTLEAREVPAGIVKVEFTKGALTLVGDDNDNAVTIITGAGAGGGPHIKIMPTFDTTIFYQQQQLAPGVALPIDEKLVSIKSAFGDGDDSLTFSSFFDVDGTGDPDFDIAGAMTIDMGAGDNTFTASPTGKVVFQDLSVMCADGFDRVIVSPRDAASGLPTGKRQHKPVTFSFGDGGFDATVSNITLPGPYGMKVTAGHSGGGGGAGGVDGSFTGRKLNIDGPFSSSTQQGSYSYSWGETNMGSFGHGGGGGSGKVSVTFSDDPGSPNSGCHVNGDVRLTGRGDLSVDVTNSTIDKSVRVQKKWLPANFRTSAVVSLTNSAVGGVDVSAVGSAAQTTLNLTDSNVNGPVSLRSTGPNGAATMDATGSCSTGAISIQGFHEANMRIIGNMRAGDPIHGVDVKLGSRHSSSLSISTGKFSARNLEIAGAVDAFLEFAGGATVDLEGRLSVRSSSSSSIGDLNGDGRLDVVGAVTVSGGDIASISSGPENSPTPAGSWISGPVTVTSPMGETHVRFDPLVLDIKGDLSVQGGFSNSVVVSPEPSASPNDVDKLTGSVRVRGGSSDDSVLVEDVDGLVDFNVDLRGGDNSAILGKKTFVIPHIVEVSGRVSISSGNGADSIELENVLVSGFTTINTGGGADTLSIGGVATFSDLCRFNMGAGDDQILIGLLLGSTAPVTFQKVLTLNAGAGNDFMALGAAMGTPDGDQNTKVVFQVTATLCDGSTGRDLFDDEACQFSPLQGTEFQKVFPSWEDPNDPI